MKKQIMIRVAFAVVIAGMVLVLAGCPEELVSVSITDRISRLQADLNGNYANVYTNWHPDSTTRSAGANPAALETAFPSSETYTISNISVTSEGESTGSATAVFNSTVTYAGDTATFTMKKDGDDWFISVLNVDAATLPKVVD